VKIKEQLIKVLNLYGKQAVDTKRREEERREQKNRGKKDQRGVEGGTYINTTKIPKATSTDREAPFHSKPMRDIVSLVTQYHSLPILYSTTTPQARTSYRETTPPAELATTVRESKSEMD
jgi:hypothetical protein